MVRIYVGPDKAKSWTLHEDMLCYYSEFFKKAFQGGFSEATTKEMWLEEDEPAVFALFVDWLYGDLRRCTQYHVAENTEHLVQWCKLSNFADKIIVEHLVSDALDRYKACCYAQELSKICPSKEAVRVVCLCQDTSSSFFRTLVEECARKYLRKGFEDFVGYGDALSTDANFAEAVGRQVLAHISLRAPECDLEDCTVHGLPTAIQSNPVRHNRPVAHNQYRF